MAGEKWTRKEEGKDGDGQYFSHRGDSYALKFPVLGKVLDAVPRGGHLRLGIIHYVRRTLSAANT
jgi:hypothetical protein